MFIDNCSAHNTIPKMSNIKVVFLPPNMTSVVQPMDMGVIKNFKHFYRQLVVQNILAGTFPTYLHTFFNVKSNKKFCIGNKEKIDVLQASRMSKVAWEKVTKKTIQNCFKKSGFIKNNTVESSDEINAIIENELEQNFISDVYNEIEKEISFEDYVTFDDNLSICGELTDDDILQSVTEIEDNNSSSDSETEVEEAIFSTTEAFQNLKKIRRYFESQEEASDILFNSLDKIDEFVLQKKIKNTKQTFLDSYFKKV